jgi:PAS domain S-box-containing protein
MPYLPAQNGPLPRAQLADFGDESARISAELLRPGGGTDPFAAAVRATRMPMIIADARLPDQPVVFTNEAFCRLTGYARDEILGRNCRFLQGPETDPAARARIRAAVAAGEPLEIEIRNHRKDGEPFWNRLLMAPVHDADGNLTYFFASQVDVTLERERLEGLEARNAALMADLADRLRAQQESEAQLRLASIAGRLGIWELDLQTHALTASAMFKENFGRDPDARFCYAALREAVHPDDRAMVGDALAWSMATGADLDLQHRIVKPDRSIGWIKLRAQTVRATDGTALRLTGIALDVTKRQLAEEGLSRTNALLNAIIETAPSLIYAKDLQGRMLLANGPVLQLIGKPWAEVEGRTDLDLLHDRAQAELVMTTDRRVMRTGRMEVLEERVDGDPAKPQIWLSTKAPLREPNGTVAGMVGVSLDITDRKQAESALRNLNQSLESEVAERTEDRNRLWQLSTDIMMVARFDGTITAVNPAWFTLLGWTEDELIGRRLFDLVHPDDQEMTLQGATSLAAGETLARFENRYRHKDGGHRWISWTAVPGGGLMNAVGRDFTEDRQRAEALQQAEEQLRQSQKMEAVGQLTGGIAHDFNNMLAVVIGSLDLLNRRIGVTDPRASRFMEAAADGARRAALLTQRLLAFYRQQPLRPETIDANKLVAGMSDLLRHALGAMIRLETVLAGGLWRTHADPNQLESAILNLAVNARDAMQEGGRLTIETQNTHLDGRYVAAYPGMSPGQYVMIAITDSGIGMSPEIIAKAFDPFFTTKEVGKGTGLGLSQVYGFVKQSGGHVKIYSEPGQGTTVKIYLPRLLAAESDIVEDITPAAIPLGEHGEVVLVVEDEPAVRQFSVDALSELGYTVLQADGAAAAMRLLAAHPEIALMFTDIVMPDVNGRKLATQARRIRPDLKVLFTTGYTRSAVVHNGVLDAGVELIGKPFTLEELAAKVRAMLDLGDGGGI